MLLNIFKSKPASYKTLNSEVKRIHELIPTDFGGGCSHQKGLLMALLISELNLKVTADIGVYRGRSLFPQAVAHRNFSKGLVYGIDPYTNEAAVQNDRPDLKDALESFVNNTDFESLFNAVSKMISEEDLQGSCNLVRKKSEDAVIEFKQNNILFDLVHIDGNHDTSFVLKDVNRYSKLLKEKSFIVLDDISWDSVKPAYDILDNQMKFVFKLVDESNDFALFAQGVTDAEMKIVKRILKMLD